MSEKPSYEKFKKKIANLEQMVADLNFKIERLQQSEELLKVMTEKSFTGVYVVQNGQFKFANTNATLYTGYAVNELVGKKCDSIIHPEDLKDIKVNARAMLRGERLPPYEFRIITKDGRIRWIAETVTAIVYEGKPAILGNSVDITERKLAEDALRESERRLADIIDFLPDATVAVDLEGKVIAWNRAIEEMTGVKASDMLGKGDFEHALPFYGERRPIIVDLVLKSDEAVEKTYLVFDKQKNELVVETWATRLNRFLWGKASPLYDNEGRIVGAIEVIRDITERKLAEDALRESERRLADIIEFLPDATFAVNLEGQLIAWNRATEELTGVKAKEMLGKGNYESSLPFWKIRRPMAINLILDPNRKFEKTYSVFKRETNTVLVEVEVPGIQIKGRNAYLWGKASPLYNNKGDIVGAIEILRDITERKLAEEALKKRERELKMKSHELEELNIALTILLKRRENDRKELEEMMVVNVKELILPYVEELKKKRKDDREMTYVKILETNLKNIISPFSHKLSLKYMNLTNREVRVAELIKEGKSSKEIADLLNVTESSVNINRYRIRKKLGLKKQDNLTVYFSSL
jgi:PAS domain S-box-containing protein